MKGGQNQKFDVKYKDLKSCADLDIDKKKYLGQKKFAITHLSYAGCDITVDGRV
jgi:hypothetical protein